MNEIISWLNTPACPLGKKNRRKAETRQAMLTKPPGSLGKLEEIAVQLAELQKTDAPCIDRVHIGIFAADHGIAAEGVSAFPQSVTVEMLKNFSSGGAAISVAANEIGASIDIINLGTVNEIHVKGITNYNIDKGSRNIVYDEAMTKNQLSTSLNAGKNAVDNAIEQNAQLFIGGEMGIANTTSATAIACALLNMPVKQLTGRGTGLDVKGVSHKAKVISEALDRHKAYMNSPLDILRCLGGFEIAALTGAYITCAQKGIPILVDGFICTVAALIAIRLYSDIQPWLLYSHVSAEKAHQIILDSISAEPIINLNMRLGEGSGAAITVPLLRMACALHNNMATFGEAGVSEKAI